MKRENARAILTEPWRNPVHAAKLSPLRRAAVTKASYDQGSEDTMGSQTQLRRLSVRLARDHGDLLAVQKLRWQVFAAEMGANIPVTGHPPAAILHRQRSL
jgi:putative hemolysin